MFPLIFKKAKMPALLTEERIYLDFTSAYYNELAKLAGMIHQFSRQKLTDAIGYRTLRNFNAVICVLMDCGWDGVSLIDADYFNDVKKLNGVTTKGNILEFYPDEVKRLNPKMPEVLKQFIES